MLKRALITGITGMVGSHLLDYLLEKTDWEIHGMLRWRSPLDNISRPSGRHQHRQSDQAPLCGLARHDVDRELRPGGAAGLRVSPRRAKLPEDLLHRAARHDGHQHPGHGAAAWRAEAFLAGSDHPCLRLVGGFRPRSAREIADQRGMHLSPRVALCDLESRRRSRRPLLRRGLQDVRHDDAHVHPYGPAQGRRFRRVRPSPSRSP